MWIDNDRFVAFLPLKGPGSEIHGNSHFETECILAPLDPALLRLE
jgi:hypothetical protein